MLHVAKPTYFNKNKYVKFYKKEAINDNSILLISQYGKNINGNIYYILKELVNNSRYSNYNINVCVTKKSIEKVKALLQKNNLGNVKYVLNTSLEYYRLLASSKYLITDTALPYCYIKKEGQVVLNLWHGTPLKTLGRKDKAEFHRLGNIQKNFVISDYLLYPNEYMMDHMIEDYMLSNLTDAKALLAGYPRNEVFFDSELRQKIREEQFLTNKQVIVYMPTWHGLLGNGL